MLKRILTGAGFVAVITGFFFLRELSPAYFQILILLFSLIGTMEILNAVGKANAIQKIVALSFSVITVVLGMLYGSSGTMLSLVFVTLSQLAVSVIFHEKTTLEGMCCALFASLYPSLLLASFTAINYMAEYSTVALLTVFVVSPFTDTFAFFVGSLLKGPKLCPNVSPKKTVSGAIGGIVGGMVGALAIYYIYGIAFSNAVPPFWFMMLVGALSSAFTEFGDLAESIIKRKAGIKDMGKILPGHGGVLDRIDGMIFAGPLVYVCFRLLLLFL